MNRDHQERTITVQEGGHHRGDLTLIPPAPGKSRRLLPGCPVMLGSGSTTVAASTTTTSSSQSRRRGLVEQHNKILTANAVPDMPLSSTRATTTRTQLSASRASTVAPCVVMSSPDCPRSSSQSNHDASNKKPASDFKHPSHDDSTEEVSPDSCQSSPAIPVNSMVKIPAMVQSSASSSSQKPTPQLQMVDPDKPHRIPEALCALLKQHGGQLPAIIKSHCISYHIAGICKPECHKDYDHQPLDSTEYQALVSALQSVMSPSGPIYSIPLEPKASETFTTKAIKRDYDTCVHDVNDHYDYNSTDPVAPLATSSPLPTRPLSSLHKKPRRVTMTFHDDHTYSGQQDNTTSWQCPPNAIRRLSNTSMSSSISDHFHHSHMTNNLTFVVPSCLGCNLVQDVLIGPGGIIQQQLQDQYRCRIQWKGSLFHHHDDTTNNKVPNRRQSTCPSYTSKDRMYATMTGSAVWQCRQTMEEMLVDAVIPSARALVRTKCGLFNQHRPIEHVKLVQIPNPHYWDHEHDSKRESPAFVWATAFTFHRALANESKNCTKLFRRWKNTYRNQCQLECVQELGHSSKSDWRTSTPYIVVTAPDVQYVWKCANDLKLQMKQATTRNKCIEEKEIL